MLENKIIKSAKGIITLKDRYLLQLRDNKKNIFFPGYWGLFGGRIDSNEMQIKTVKREIKEETNLNIKATREILNIDFNMIGLKKKKKYYLL
ncbi:NUDIX domain-containing protein [Pelagibacteraceae bacterium]|nr:NUDIX domain-containing protein [Pelagibacteraceae bacterium]